MSGVHIHGQGRRAHQVQGGMCSRDCRSGWRRRGRSMPHSLLSPSQWHNQLGTGKLGRSFQGVITKELVGTASRQPLQGKLITGWYPAMEKRPYEVPAHTEQEKLDTPRRLFLGEGAMPCSLPRSRSAQLKRLLFSSSLCGVTA